MGAGVSIYSEPKPGSVRERLCKVILRDIGVQVHQPHRTKYKCYRRSTGQPSWMVYNVNQHAPRAVFGSRSRMTDCVRYGVHLTDSVEDNFIHIVEPNWPKESTR